MRGSSPKGAGQARRARSWGNHAAPAGGHDLREGEPRRRRGGTPQGCPVPGAPGFLLVYSCCPFSETTPKTPPRPRKRGQRAGETAFIPLDVVRAGHPSRSRPPVTGLDGLPRQRARRGSPWCSSGWRVKGRNPGWCGPQPGTGEDTGRDGEGAARPLTRQERPQPIGKGEEQGRSPLGLPPQPVGQVPTREALKPKRFQVKPEGREGGRRQTDEACSAHGRRPPAFSAKPCGGSAPMRLVLGLGG